MDNAELKRRYRWQCRRGASEVEGVLYAYLDHYFDDDTPENQAFFAELLACHDVDMIQWFTRRSEPETPQLRDYVRHVLAKITP